MGWGIGFIFLTAAALMVARVLPALLALPLMATGMGVLLVGAGQLTWQDVFLGIWADGSLRLAEPMVIALLGGMLSSWLQKTGVAQNLVRGGGRNWRGTDLGCCRCWCWGWWHCCFRRWGAWGR
jgi:hypothetical protein